MGYFHGRIVDIRDSKIGISSWKLHRLGIRNITDVSRDNIFRVVHSSIR